MDAPYTDRKGRRFEVDPSGRYPFRMARDRKNPPPLAHPPEAQGPEGLGWIPGTGS